MIMADVLNLYFAVNKKFPERRLDFEKYLDLFRSKGEIFRAVAYGIDRDPAKSMKFKGMLASLGYIVRYRQVQSKYAINNYEIIFDTMRTLNMFDVFVLGSSDFNMYPLCKFLKEQGKEVIVASCYIPHELREIADSYIDLSSAYMKEPTNDLDSNQQFGDEPENFEEPTLEIPI